MSAPFHDHCPTCHHNFQHNLLPQNLSQIQNFPVSFNHYIDAARKSEVRDVPPRPTAVIEEFPDQSDDSQLATKRKVRDILPFLIFTTFIGFLVRITLTFLVVTF